MRRASLYLDRSVGYRDDMTTPEQRHRTAKQRLLEAADDLFYNEGIHAVGIDRVIAHAGVAKGSLYYSFAGKDDLVREYLTGRHGKWAERVTAGIEAHSDPRQRILAVYDALGALFAEPDYRGCAFVNAMAEAAPDSVEAEAATIVPRLGSRPVPRPCHRGRRRGSSAAGRHPGRAVRRRGGHGTDGQGSSGRPDRTPHRGTRPRQRRHPDTGPSPPPWLTARPSGASARRGRATGRRRCARSCRPSPEARASCWPQS